MLKHVNQENFESEVLKSKTPILVDFFATWCGPCRMLGPVLEKISNSRAGFDIAKVDIDGARDLALKYGIEVVKTEYLDGNVKIETKEIKNLTNNIEEEEKILTLLRNNEVTPIGVEDVLKEIL